VGKESKVLLERVLDNFFKRKGKGKGKGKMLKSHKLWRELSNDERLLIFSISFEIDYNEDPEADIQSVFLISGMSKRDFFDSLYLLRSRGLVVISSGGCYVELIGEAKSQELCYSGYSRQ